MNKTLIPAFTIWAAVVIVSVGILAAFSYFAIPAEELNEVYNIQWTYFSTVKQLLHHATAITAAALILVYSSAMKEELEARRLQNGSVLVMQHVLLVVILAFTVFVAKEVFTPLIVQNQIDMKYQSSRQFEFLQYVDGLVQDNRILEARELLDDYLEIVPDDPTAKAMAEDLREVYANSNAYRETGPSSVPDAAAGAGETTETTPAGVASLLTRAQSALDNEEYEQAVYYARLHKKVYGRDAAAASVRDEAYRRLKSVGVNTEEAIEQQRYLGLQAARKAYDLGNYTLAYYLFKNLDTDIGREDIKFYYDRTVSKILQESFFIGDAIDALEQRGINDFAFIVQGTAGTTSKWLVTMTKYVKTGIFCFGEDVSITEILSNGSPGLSSYSPYVRFKHNRAVLSGVHRENYQETLKFRPEIIGNESGLSVNTINMYFNSEEAGYISRLDSSLDSLNIIQLNNIADKMKIYGYVDDVVHIEMIMRVLYPFSFFILCLMAIALGWRLRKNSDGFPIIRFVISLPLVIGLLGLFTAMFQYASRLLFTALLFTFGYVLLQFLFVIIQIILIIAVLFFFSRQLKYR